MQIDVTVPKLAPLADRLVRAGVGIAFGDLFPGQHVVRQTATSRTVRVTLPPGVAVGHTLASGPLELMADQGDRIRVTVPASWARYLRVVRTVEVKGNEARTWIDPGWSAFAVPLPGGHELGFAPVPGAGAR